MECSDVCKAACIRSVTNRETNSQRHRNFEIVNKKKRGSSMRVVLDFSPEEARPGGHSGKILPS